MGNVLSSPNNQPISGKGKTNYVRKSASVVPTALPFKRQPEGSVLTGGSVAKGNAQPDSRGKAQTMSKKLKGGAD